MNIFHRFFSIFLALAPLLYLKIERHRGVPSFVGIYQVPNGTKNLCTFHKLLG